MAKKPHELLMPIDRKDIPEDLAAELQCDLERDFERNAWAYVDDGRYHTWRSRQQRRHREMIEAKRKQVEDAK